MGFTARFRDVWVVGGVSLPSYLWLSNLRPLA